MKNKVELLSPVGSMEALEKAVFNGANAVYLAGKSFGARAYANNFSDQELIEAINFAHLYDVKVYVTVNTLIYENELSEVISFLDLIYLNGVDAVIVQDLGLARIIKLRYPDIEMHASTQMNVQTLEEVLALENLGFKRVVLGREVDLKEIKRIKENSNVELEVFIHGALCISYSGNCFMSSLIGQRSGNRGKCAQPCRMEYTINNKTKYYFSTKDLCTLSNLKDIIPYVDSLKIEGRMKNPSYVGVVTHNYNKAINDYYNNKNVSVNDSIKELKTVFNRDFTKGYINNENRNDITNINSQNHLGLLIGNVVDNNRKGFVKVKLYSDLHRDDCLRITANNNILLQKDVIIVNEIYKGKQLVKEAKKGDIVTITCHKKLNSDDQVYITKSLYLDQKYNHQKKITVIGKCYLKNDLLYMEVSDGKHVVNKSIEVEKSNNDMSVRIKEQLSKLKETPFELSSLKGENLYCFTQIKNINQLRRDVFDELSKMRMMIKDRVIIENSDLKSYFNSKNDDELLIAVTNEEQILALKESKLKQYKLLIKDKKLYECYKNDLNCCYYPSRIANKCAENCVVSTVYGVKNNYVSPYFNVTNSYTIRALESLGAKKIGLSIELSYEKMKEMIEHYQYMYNQKPNLYCMIYGYYQAMIMKHCVLSKEYNCEKTKCGLCAKGIEIIDRAKKSYKLTRDENCNSVVLFYEPVNLFSEIDLIKKLEINSFLIDFTVESYSEVLEVISQYEQKKSIEKCYKGHFYNNNL